MIDAIGFKRLLVIAVLAATCIVLGVLNFYIFQPQSAAANQKLNGARSQNDTLRAEIVVMQSGMERFRGQKALFDRINKMGVFGEQNRVLARERFDAMQKLSKIIAAKYQIRAANVVASTNVDPTTGQIADETYGVLRSPISVSLSALDDLDVYRFVYYLNYSFPGHITIKELHMKRTDGVTVETLKMIGGGNASELITAQMELDWSTIVNKNDVPIPSPSATPETTP